MLLLKTSSLFPIGSLTVVIRRESVMKHLHVYFICIYSILMKISNEPNLASYMEKQRKPRLTEKTVLKRFSLKDSPKKQKCL